MPIQPLQLPRIIDLPKIDFSGLDKIGDAIGEYRQRSALADSLPGVLGTQVSQQASQGNGLATLGQPQAWAAPSAAPQNDATVPIGSSRATTADPATAIASIESGGRYDAVGPLITSGKMAGQRAIGKYQVMESNIGPWTKQYFGQELTPQQYVATPAAQDAVFKGEFGRLSQAHGPDGAARAWFAGEGGMNDPNRKDQLGTTVAQYGNKFAQATQPQGAPQPGPQGAAPGAVQPNAGGINPQMIERLQAMIRAGGDSQKMALALVGKYLTPQYGFQVLPDGTIVRTNQVSGTVEPVYQANKPPVPVSEGTSLVDPRTGQVVYSAPAKPVNVAEGGSLIDPRTGQPVYQAPPKPVNVGEGGSLVDPRTGKPLYEAPSKPVSQAPGAQLVDPRTGKVVVAATTNGLISDQAIESMAKQYRAGDISVTANLGRGAQGAENIKKLKEEVDRQNREIGRTPEEQAMIIAEYGGIKAGQRTVGNKSANIELAATEFNQILPIVQKASEAVSRTNFPDLNKIIQAFNEKTGDPKIVAFGGAVNTLVNLYARAISPSGNPTVSDKEHAREILNKAWSQGQFNAAVGMMKQEIDAAMASPDKVREEMRKRFLEGQQPKGADKPTDKKTEAVAPTQTAQQDAPAQGSEREPLPKGTSGAMVVAEAKKRWATADREDKAAMVAKAAQFGIDLRMYGLK